MSQRDNGRLVKRSSMAVPAEADNIACNQGGLLVSSIRAVPQPWYFNAESWISENGDAWSHFSHDHARSRAFRWGEDGIAGVCESHGLQNIALSFWNQEDAFSKERLFGLSNPQGNHGESIKEAHFHLDNVPTHSYMKYLYKYPQGSFPYEDLITENAKRGKMEKEYQLIDTGIFEE